MSLNKENVRVCDDRIDDSDDDLFAAVPDLEYLKNNSLCNIQSNMKGNASQVRSTGQFKHKQHSNKIPD